MTDMPAAQCALDARPAGDAAGLLADLLERTSTGDAAAFRRLYDDVSPRMFGLILRVVTSRAIAEEILQDVFLHIWTEAALFDRTRGAAISWMLTIAHRRAVDAVRHLQSSSERDRRVGFRDLAPNLDTVAEQVDQRDEARRLNIAMRELTDRQRSVLHLAYHAGRTQREIAAIKGIPLGTVKTTTRAALVRLRKVLSTA